MKKGIYPLLSSSKFVNAVHPSGYRLLNDSPEIASFNDELSKLDIETRKIEAIKPDEDPVLKIIDLEELYIDIFNMTKLIGPKYLKMRSFYESEEFIDLVNKNGLLTSLKLFRTFDVVERTYINALDKFLDPKNNMEQVKYSQSIINKKLLKGTIKTSEPLNICWSPMFHMHQPDSAKWGYEIKQENNLINSAILYMDIDNQDKLHISCLGTAIVLFRRQFNYPEVKECENNSCKKTFVDCSRSNNQKFCKDACRVAAYKSQKINDYRKKLSSDYEYLNFDKLTYRDIELRQIRINCPNHGKSIIKIDDFVRNPFCPKCKS